MQQQYFVGDKAVATVIDTERKTPLKKPMLKICYEDGSYDYMPENRFNVVKTTEKSNASAARAALIVKACADIGPIIYSLLHEYGLRLSEVEPILNEAVALTNAASEKASNLLWQVDYADERTLNQIQDILLENASKNSDNAGPSDGTGSPAQDKK